MAAGSGQDYSVKQEKRGRPTIPPWVEVAVRILESLRPTGVPEDRELWNRSVKVLNEYLKERA